MDTRFNQLCQWLSQTTGISNPTLEMVAGDASFRRYYRLHRPQDTCILMDAPPPEEDCTPFVRIAGHWFRQGVRVPRILAQDPEQGFLLLEDFGDDQLISHLIKDEATTDQLYQNAIQALIRLQQTTEPVLPTYSQQLLMQEMSLFKEWFCRQWLELELTPAETSLLDHTFEHLCHNALQQVQVPVHRDYHSRNLMLISGQEIGIIDFQDAVQGPVTYDLVSLLKDCYLHWPKKKVSHWRDSYRQQAQAAGLLPAEISQETFRQAFDLMGAQRHIKVLGIFSRLWLRDNKPGYLKDIPRTLQHLLEATGEYQNLNRFHQWLLERILPAVNAKQQPAKENA